MSRWATIEADFHGVPEWVVREDMPTGSEDGPVVVRSEGNTTVEGRLRDTDDTDSAAVLAWFIRVCSYGPAEYATLMFDVDGGPRYRWRWLGGVLQRLHGILDG